MVLLFKIITLKLRACLLHQNGEVRFFGKVFDPHRIAHAGASGRVVQFGLNGFSAWALIGDVMGVFIVHTVFGRDGLLLFDPRYDGICFHTVFADFIVTDEGINQKADDERHNRTEQNVFHPNISIPPQGALTGCVRMVHPDYARNPYAKSHYIVAHSLLFFKVQR